MNPFSIQKNIFMSRSRNFCTQRPSYSKGRKLPHETHNNLCNPLVKMADNTIFLERVRVWIDDRRPVMITERLQQSSDTLSLVFGTNTRRPMITRVTATPTAITSILVNTKERWIDSLSTFYRHGNLRKHIHTIHQTRWPNPPSLCGFAASRGFSVPRRTEKSHVRANPSRLSVALVRFLRIIFLGHTLTRYLTLHVVQWHANSSVKWIFHFIFYCKELLLISNVRLWWAKENSIIDKHCYIILAKFFKISFSEYKMKNLFD